ncbi:MAG TPA: ATP-binding cassette domain-containing protein [Actinomycetota bacterium]|nr:ATP-binding cassette domain-containing protein [Actinomycetota bacterium]
MSEGPTSVAPHERLAVEMREAQVRIEGRTVLGPIDLEVGRGERWVLLGPNGGGKTTLLSLAGARRQPSSGRVTVLGITLGTGDVRALHPRISHTSHVLAERMPPDLSVRTVVLTGKRATLSPWFQEFDEVDERRAVALLERVGCGHLAARRFATASQGERQRVLLARALFPDPELLILDEPASGLDLPAREALIEALEAVESPSGPTTIVATHHLEEIPPSSTHAALLRDGLLVASGEIEGVLTPRSLEGCFGIAMEVGRRGARWWATAGPPRAGPART